VASLEQDFLHAPIPKRHGGAQARHHFFSKGKP